MAMRVVMESCKLVGRGNADGNGNGGSNGAQGLSEKYRFADELTLAFSSAFSEIFNNIVLHAYGGGSAATSIRCELIIAQDHIAVMLTDTGKAFDIDAVPPLEDPLPMGGMGIHIARTMLDELDYQSGPPNRWRLVKYVQQSSEQHAAPSAPAE